MAYEVTATRRRPQHFEDLVGQEFVVATLKNAIQSGKIAHAYLFSGPRGCGKTSTARILAKALNCEKGPTAEPCEECTSCREITKGSSFDVIEIDGASNTSVNDIRQIKDEILFPPNSSKYKIYIIDEVHMLSNSAFNALLKTIEEPPEYVIFIFATTELHKVPATIKSRCQQFHFRLGSVDQIKDVLAKACAEINVQAEDEALYWIAREATGSFRDAYTLFDQVLAFSDGHITYEKIRDKLGLVGVDALNEISEFCVDGNSKAALEKLDEMLTNGVSIEQFVSNYADYIRSLLLIESGIKKEGLLGQNIERYSKKVLSVWNKYQLERALSLFLNLFREIRYSLSPRYETELAISRLCWLSQYVSVNEVKAVIESARNLLIKGASPIIEEGKDEIPDARAVQKNNFKMPPFPGNEGGGGSPNPFLNSGNHNDQNSAQIPAEEVKEQDSNENFFNEEFVRNDPSLSLEELKTQAIKELGVKDPLSGTLLKQTKNWSVSDGIIKLEVENSYMLKSVEDKGLQFSKLLGEIWGKPVQIKALVMQRKEVEVPEDYPMVIKAIRDIVRGQVVSVSVAGSKTEGNKAENDKTSVSENTASIQNNESESENDSYTDESLDMDEEEGDDDEL
ncbi:MAG: DNA polymerase III subunit gamma/tau [Treponemataceae bacterium]|nr:DNA polymerase III subunit gamma/tau [Treponemataceae bacterium]